MLHRKILAVFVIALTLGLSPGLFAQADKPDALAQYRAGRTAESNGQIVEAGNNYDRAVRICIDEINANRATTDTYTVLCWTLQRQKKYKDVITWGQKALKIKENEWRIIETMGEAYFYLNEYKNSLTYLQRYVSAQPQGTYAPNAYFFIGEIYRIERKFRYADIAYTTAVQLQSQIALWWYRLGLARENAGDLEPALQAYERSQKLDPSYARTNEALTRTRQALTNG
jgi:tetratricopeptide (TPR) repeat protein